MNQRNAYLLQVLEKIGAPLMTAILLAPGRENAGDQIQKDAQRMAELLGKTTLASIEMSSAVDFGPAQEQSDSLRVALAALASGIVGSHFRHSGKAPGDNDVRKMTAALQTVLTFSENFMPGPDAAVRLENLQAAGQAADASQVSLQYINSFVPVVNAITSFPFGQPEQKLIMDVSARLIKKAEDIRAASFGPLPDDDKKRAELSILGALAKIYAACHEAETARLMAGQQTGGGLDAIWQAFDLRASLVETLAKTLVPAQGGAAGSQASGGPSPVQPAEAPPAQPAIFAPPPAAPAAPVAPPAAGGNPMSMFAKKPPEEGNPAPPASSPPAAPPVFTPPPAQSPATPPPAAPPADAPPSGGPMSFFKKPPEKE